MKKGFQKFGNRQYRTVISDRREVNETILTIASAY